MSKYRVGGIILAGGKSSRMGEDKSLMNFRGKRLVENVVDSIRPYTSSLLIVANEWEKFSFIDGVSFTRDILVDKGPLIGMISGLEVIEEKWSFITSCDMPFINGELIEYLYERKDGLGVFIGDDNYFEPLLGLYNKDIVSRAKEYFNRCDGRLNGFLKDLERQNLIVKISKDEISREFGEEIFININNREIYNEIKKGYLDE